jgi:hypothetical protein
MIKSGFLQPLLARFVRQKNHYLWFFGIFSTFVIVIARIFFEVSSQNYDWDIDHEMYFGQELLKGNLIWVNEFHDKLPFVQYLFSIPAAFESIFVWRVVSIVSAIFAFLSVLFFLPGILEKIGYSKSEANRASYLAGGLYLLISSYMPGGFTHINAFASSTAIIATLFCVAVHNLNRGLNPSLIFSIVAGSAAAVSISVRPYFIFPLAVAFLIVSFLILLGAGVSVAEKFLRLFVLLISPIVIGIFINLAPYLILGKGREFWDGLAFFLSSTNSPGGSLLDVFLGWDLDSLGPSWRIWLVCMLLFSAINVLFSLRLGVQGLVWLVIPLGVVLLTIGILSQHFWPHYVNLYSWYFSIILSAHLVRMGEGRSLITPSKRQDSGARVVALVSCLAIAVSFSSFIEAKNEHPHLAIANFLETRIGSTDFSRQSFLAPENIYVHWKLGESRHGFPHAANTLHIIWGFWEKSDRQLGFRHPENIFAYCSEIRESEIDLLVVSEGSIFQNCFVDNTVDWREERVSISDTELWSLWWRR